MYDEFNFEIEGNLEVQQGVFPAQITAVFTDSLSRPNYAFAEQSFDPTTGVLEDAVSPRSGDGMIVVAYELNNQVVSVPRYVWMRLRGNVGGVPAFEFLAGATPSSSSSSHSSSSSSSSKLICNPISFNEYQPRCEGSVLNVYARNLSLTTSSGCLVGPSYGPWLFAYHAGCCTCPSSSSSSQSSTASCIPGRCVYCTDPPYAWTVNVTAMPGDCEAFVGNWTLTWVNDCDWQASGSFLGFPISVIMTVNSGGYFLDFLWFDAQEILGSATYFAHGNPPNCCLPLTMSAVDCNCGSTNPVTCCTNICVSGFPTFVAAGADAFVGGYDLTVSGFTGCWASLNNPVAHPWHLWDGGCGNGPNCSCAWQAQPNGLDQTEADLAGMTIALAIIWNGAGYVLGATMTSNTGAVAIYQRPWDASLNCCASFTVPLLFKDCADCQPCVGDVPDYLTFTPVGPCACSGSSSSLAGCPTLVAVPHCCNNSSSHSSTSGTSSSSSGSSCSFSNCVPFVQNVVCSPLVVTTKYLGYSDSGFFVCAYSDCTSCTNETCVQYVAAVTCDHTGLTLTTKYLSWDVNGFRICSDASCTNCGTLTQCVDMVTGVVCQGTTLVVTTQSLTWQPNGFLVCNTSCPTSSSASSTSSSSGSCETCPGGWPTTWTLTISGMTGNCFDMFNGTYTLTGGCAVNPSDHSCSCEWLFDDDNPSNPDFGGDHTDLMITLDIFDPTLTGGQNYAMLSVTWVDFTQNIMTGVWYCAGQPCGDTPVQPFNGNCCAPITLYCPYPTDDTGGTCHECIGTSGGTYPLRVTVTPGSCS